MKEVRQMGGLFEALFEGVGAIMSILAPGVVQW
jgi:hypothetical protein